MTPTPPFDRTTCACHECVKCCKRQPGPLAPGDFERITAHLGESEEDAKRHFRASPGALVKGPKGLERIGSIVPAYRKGRCVFLDENDRCKIHTVAPFGCAYFDTHMGAGTAHPRSIWLVQQCMASEAYRQLRDSLSYTTVYRPKEY